MIKMGVFHNAQSLLEDLKKNTARLLLQFCVYFDSQT